MNRRNLEKSNELVRHLKSSRTTWGAQRTEDYLVLRTLDRSAKPRSSTHTAHPLHESPVKKKQMQPAEAFTEKRAKTNGSVTAGYNGTKPLKSVIVVWRWSILTHWLPLIVLAVPLKPRPVNMVIEQAWQASSGAPTSAAVAIVALRRIAAIVEKSFMFVLLWSLSYVMSSPPHLAQPPYKPLNNPRLTKPFGGAHSVVMTPSSQFGVEQVLKSAVLSVSMPKRSRLLVCHFSLHSTRLETRLHSTD